MPESADLSTDMKILNEQGRVELLPAIKRELAELEEGPEQKALRVNALMDELDIQDSNSIIFFGAITIAIQIGDGHHGIGYLNPHKSDIATVQGPEHFNCMIGGFRIDVFHGNIPDFSSHFTSTLIHNNTMGELMGKCTDLTHRSAGAWLSG